MNADGARSIYFPYNFHKEGTRLMLLALTLEAQIVIRRTI